MKKVKNMLAAGMLLVMGVSAVSANSGMLIHDRNGSTPQSGCESSILQNLAGAANAIGGMILSDFTGIIIVDKSAPCTQKDGIIIVDRDGIIIVD